MYILDTDTVSNFLDKRRGYDRLRERIQHARSSELWVSVITLEEILRGVLDLIRRAQSERRAAAGAYALLADLFEDLRSFQILPYTVRDEELYAAITAAVRRAGSNDCRIAASALARGFTVITSNTRHFSQVPGMAFEDWNV